MNYFLYHLIHGTMKINFGKDLPLRNLPLNFQALNML